MGVKVSKTELKIEFDVSDEPDLPAMHGMAAVTMLPDHAVVLSDDGKITIFVHGFARLKNGTLGKSRASAYLNPGDDRNPKFVKDIVWLVKHALADAR